MVPELGVNIMVVVAGLLGALMIVIFAGLASTSMADVQSVNWLESITMLGLFVLTVGGGGLLYLKSSGR